MAKLFCINCGNNIYFFIFFQIFLLFFIIGLTLADFAANDLRRYAKAKSAATAAGGRLMRPVRLVNRRPGGDVRIKTNNRDVMTPAESRPVDQRFTNFGLNQNEANTNFGGRPNFRPTNSYNPQSQRVGVGHTYSPIGYLGNVLRFLSYLVSF
jgi:hypothetical protein